MSRSLFFATGCVAAVVLLGPSAAAASAGTHPLDRAARPAEAGRPAPPPQPSPKSGLLQSGRQLTPRGRQVTLGNFPTGAALTANGRYLWTVSTGFTNDIRIVDTVRHKVCQVLVLPGASGGIALDSAHHRAYVSGLPNSRWTPSLNGVPGARGDDVLVFTWTRTCGHARLDRVIPVPPPATAPLVQVFPPIPADNPAARRSWPQKLAVSPDGTELLVPLNMADRAAVVDLSRADGVRYVPTGSYPFGAAIAPGGRIGLVTNEASGTLSMIDLERAEKIADVRVGAPLSHPQGVVVDATGRRAYVAVSGSDDVTVVDLRQRKVLRVISVGRFAKLGTQPVALALGPGGRRLFVAESGGDEISVVRLPGKHRSRRDWKVTGRIPVASQPQAVAAVGPRGRRPAQLVWVSAKGEGIGPNPRGTNPTSTDPVDPIFWAFVSKAPNYDIFKNPAVTYLGTRVNGKAGFLRLPSTRLIRALTPAATRQLHPVGATRAPAKTPLRAHGPIKHVFFIVRENRSYDQLLGDVGRGNSDPKLTVFGRSVTPNMHSLVTRFPLLDHVYANSEASIEGHFWTSAATVPDYVNRNWIQNYAGRGRPSDFGQYAVTFPGNGFLFDQAQRQRISYFNYGEAFAGDEPSIPDRDRSEAQLAESTQVAAHSDLGPPFGGCYPSDIGIGNALDGNETFDSSLPAGAPAHSYSHVDCFRARFAQQLAAHAVPSFSYLSLTSDHTRGTQPGFPTPSAMVADSDLAVGQIVDTISHSSIWKSSAIFVVEDDSQDGADHVDAHRIPAMVISPFARRGAVVHNRYDLLSVTRSIELILGMKALSINDLLATPMYDVFSPKPANIAPVTAIASKVDLLQRNTAASPLARVSAGLALGETDTVPQWQLDDILWKSVFGADSTAPPPGPGAESGS